jgi:hypothetical protein
VHDISDFESRGLPAVFVASSEFEQAAQVQAKALGFVAAGVLVPHPIQDRTDDEMRAKADAAYEQILRAVTA